MSYNANDEAVQGSMHLGLRDGYPPQAGIEAAGSPIQVLGIA